MLHRYVAPFLKLLCVISDKSHSYHLRLFTSMQEGFTPLHYACQFGKTECVKVLLQSGANLHALTKVRPYLHVLHYMSGTCCVSMHHHIAHWYLSNCLVL